MKERIKNLITNNRTIAEFFIAIWVFGIICQIALAVAGIWYEPFRKEPVYYYVGLWVGILIATIYVYFLQRSLSKALDFESETATKLVRRDSIIRYFSLVIVLGVLMITDIISPLTAFLGIMGIKAGAYLTPLTDKVMIIFIGEEPVAEGEPVSDDNDIE